MLKVLIIPILHSNLHPQNWTKTHPTFPFFKYLPFNSRFFLRGETNKHPNMWGIQLNQLMCFIKRFPAWRQRGSYVAHVHVSLQNIWIRQEHSKTKNCPGLKYVQGSHPSTLSQNRGASNSEKITWVRCSPKSSWGPPLGRMDDVLRPLSGKVRVWGEISQGQRRFWS